METTTRTLSEIAWEIKQEWPEPYFGAVPYIEAMTGLRTIQDNYYQDTASSIVLYFLSNATTWRGESARRIKAELKQLLKEK